MKIFVYGTLKSGFSNHILLEELGAKFIGKAIVQGFTLHDLVYYPAAVMTDNDSKISGEVYEIEDISMLDHLEDYPEMYDRMQVITQYGWVWIYYQDAPNGRIIPNGAWLEK